MIVLHLPVSQYEASMSDVGRKDKPEIADNLYVCKLMLVFGSLFLRLEES